MSVSQTSVNVQIVLPGKDKDDEGSSNDCTLSMEVEAPEDGFEIGETYPVRVFLGTDVSGVKTFSSNGIFVDSRQTETFEVEEDITFSDDVIASLPYKIESGLTWTLVGDAYDFNGKKLPFPKFLSGDGGKNLFTSNPIFAIVHVTYMASCLIYNFTPSESGSAQLIATANSEECGKLSSTLDVEVNEESSSCCCSSCRSSLEITTTDVILIYKDFVNGQPIAGAKVFLNGVPKGKTDDSGSITLFEVTVNVVHKIKAIKGGYLNTDSDSLSNDSFIVEV